MNNNLQRASTEYGEKRPEFINGLPGGAVDGVILWLST